MAGNYFSFAGLACRAAIAFDFLRLNNPEKPADVESIKDLASFLEMSQEPELIDTLMVPVFLTAMKEVYPAARVYQKVQELATGVLDVKAKLEKSAAERTYEPELAKFCLELSKSAGSHDLRHLDYKVTKLNPAFQ